MSSPDASSWKTVSEGECPGRWCTRHARPANSQQRAVGQRRADGAARAPGAERARHGPQGDDDVRRDAVAQHDRLGEGVVGLHDLRVARQPRRQRVERAHLGARAVGQDRHQPDVVDVLVGDDDPLEVLDAAAVLGQRRLERRQRRRRVRAGVDQRERVVLDEVAVDAPHRERRRDAERVDAPRSRSRQPQLAGGGAHGLVVGAQQLDRAHPQPPPRAIEEGDVDPRRLDGRPPAQARRPRRGLSKRRSASRWVLARTRVATPDGRRPSAPSVAGSSRSSRPSGSRSSSADERQLAGRRARASRA